MAASARAPAGGLRLAYLSHYFPPESNAPAARVHELSRALVRARHEVHVVTAQPTHPRGVVHPGYRAAEYRRDRVDGIEVHRVPTLAPAHRGVLARGVGYAALPPMQVAIGLARVPRVDVVMATSPQILTGLAGLVLARARRVPFVLEVRDLWPDGIVAVGALRAEHPAIGALRRLENALYRAAAGVVSVTDGFVEHFVRRGVPPSRIAVIKNGIDPSLFDAKATTPGERAATRTALGAGPDELLVLYCGNVGLPQDVGLLARAAAIAPADLRLRIVIVGDGPSRHEVAAEVERLGVGATVSLLPAVPRREVPGLLAAADVGVVILRDDPTFTRYLPSKIFEIMAMGTPIAIGVAGEAQRLVERAGAGIAFAPGDAGALLGALERLAAMGPDDRRRMGEAGRAHVLAHHDRNRQAADLAGFLARIRDAERSGPNGRLE